MLMENKSLVSLISFKSYKSRRVTRSVLGAEIIAFADMFDEAISIHHRMQEILKQRIPLQLLTDSKYLFDAISKRSRTYDRRLMIVISSVRQGYQNTVIDNIGFVRTEHNLAAGLTKQKTMSTS